MPTAWMSRTYEALGLGEWPGMPLFEYLARTASMMYAFTGALVVLASFDVPRYRPLIRALGWLSLPGGVYLFVLDIALGMPGWWVWSEGPVVLATGVVLLWLLRRAGR